MSSHTKIEKLWIPPATKVLMSHQKEVIGYMCICYECIKINKDGIGYSTPEHLLEHRKMNAFMCPRGCGFHVSESFTSIIGHLKIWHQDILEELVDNGLNLQSKEKVWITHNEDGYEIVKQKEKKPQPQVTYENSVMPDTEKSALESAGIILNLPQRVIPPPIIYSDEEEVEEKKEKKKKTIMKTTLASKPLPVSTKKWTSPSVSVPIVPLATVMEQEQKQPTPIIENKLNEYKNVPKETDTKQSTHYAPFDMYKEKQCPNGKSCINKHMPRQCAYNHDETGDIISMGTELTPEVLCVFDRPPFMRCGNTLCTHVHLTGRFNFIQKKTQLFQEKSKLQYNNIIGELDANSKPDKMVTFITPDGTKMTMTDKDAKTIKKILRNTEQTDDSFYEGTIQSSIFNDEIEIKIKMDKIMEQPEVDDDLTNDEQFAKAFVA